MSLLMKSILKALVSLNLIACTSTPAAKSIDPTTGRMPALERLDWVGQDMKYFTDSYNKDNVFTCAYQTGLLYQSGQIKYKGLAQAIVDICSGVLKFEPYREVLDYDKRISKAAQWSDDHVQNNNLSNVISAEALRSKYPAAELNDTIKKSMTFQICGNLGRFESNCEKYR